MLLLEAQLAQQTYFGGNGLNMADIVVGATIPPLFQRLDFSLTPYPALSHWQKVLRRWIQVSRKCHQRQTG